MKKLLLFLLLMACISSYTSAQTYHLLSGGILTENWTSNLITTDDDWSGYANFRGFRGDNLTATTGTDPRTLLADDVSAVLDVNANQTTPNSFATGGVAEFEITNRTIALAGSGTADAPYLVIYINTTGVTNAYLSFKALDLENGTDNATQQIAVHYRIGTTGSWTNITDGYIADASTVSATQETLMNFQLPAAIVNNAQVQIRIMTTNAVGNDEWIGIDDIIVSQNIILPITLTSFTGKEANKSIVLNWVTASEKNNKTFELFRSVDGKSFKSIGKVAGAGDSDAELKYSFIDANPFGGTNYYQLKQIDFDGKSSTSQIIPVDSKIEDTKITVYATSKVNIGITSPNETTGKLSLFDISGRKISEQNINLNKGYNTLELNDNLNPGIHFITLENEGKLYRQKFVK